MMLIGFLLWSDRLTINLATGGRWGIGGWIAGLLIGLANAGIRDMPLPVSAMGMSFCLGLTAAGIGFGYQIGRDTTRSFSIWTLAAMAGCGAGGGILGHLARAMFYASPYSFLWPAGIGFMSGAILFAFAIHHRGLSRGASLS
jgi:hypothetical protein